MSIMNSALQTLSEMAIQETGVEIPQETSENVIDQLKTMLDGYPMLEAKECMIIPEMIPIKESRRLGYYLIEAEDISRYMSTNGIKSFQEAVTNVITANGLPDSVYSKVALVIDEDSILDELASLGNNIDSDYWEARPPKGLGLPMIGKSQHPGEFDKLRKIANTKQMLDVLTNRYGLPIVKKNYKQIGLLETANINPAGKNAVLNEKPATNTPPVANNPAPATAVKEETESTVNEGCCSCGKSDCPTCGKKKKSLKEEEEAPTMTAHEAYIQRIKDIASGKLDHELFV